MRIDSSGPTSRQAWYITIVLGMASYLDAAAIAGTSTALVLYQQTLGLTGQDVGNLSAILTASIAIGALVGGRLGDRFGRRRVFTVTIVVYLLAAAVLATAPHIGIIYAGLIALGLAAGGDLPVSLSMIGEAAPDEKRGRMIALTQGLWVVGIVGSLVIGILFGGTGDLAARILYGHLAVIAALVLVLRMGIPESSKWKSASDTRTAGLALPRGEDIGALRNLFTSKYVLALIALALFFGIANISANTNGQFQNYLYVNVAGTDVPTASMWAMISIAIGFATTFVFMKFVDGRRTRIIMLSIAAVMAIAAFMLPAIAGVHVWSIVTSTILYSLGGGMIGEPMYKVWSQEIIPTLFRSSAQGITIAFTRAVAAVVALVTPAIIAADPTYLYWFLVGTTVISAAIGLFWLTRFPKAVDEAGITSSNPIPTPQEV